MMEWLIGNIYAWIRICARMHARMRLRDCGQWLPVSLCGVTKSCWECAAFLRDWISRDVNPSSDREPRLAACRLGEFNWFWSPGCPASRLILFIFNKRQIYVELVSKFSQTMFDYWVLSFSWVPRNVYVLMFSSLSSNEVPRSSMSRHHLVTSFYCFKKLNCQNEMYLLNLFATFLRSEILLRIVQGGNV
jgi:hypothetical protein